ncbi:response regulator [Flagellimonas meridianipacifica]|uniref:CRP-like cAMP-binding protein n=1 Tax=Flagellimonas meridianipacifica TaxID=1080225 RepID=A0A2T0MAW6_9FLAO|nr:response regulator [Allomuricauda pacifica]PRX54656.1 CRP-like cAMP-binding protein [Allomuricauda pacifica]
MKNILLIEDNKDVLENTAEILGLANYNVIKARNGMEGVALARQNKPDIIVCDILMPELDGYGVLETLNKDAQTAGTPFIFLTAKSEIRDIRMGMTKGADDYLIKPFEEHELLEAIDLRLRKNDFLKRKFSKTAKGLNTFFKEATEHFGMELLSNDRKLRELEDQEEVFREGDSAHSLFFIQKGNIKTFKITTDGKELITGMHKEGDFVGQLSLLNHCGTYTETATAISETEVLSIPKEDFMKLVYENKIVSNKFLHIISNNLAHVQDQLIDMAFAPVKKRAAKALIELHEKGMMEDSEHQGLEIPREDFAAMIGTATETAIRTLSDFKSQGLVRLGKKKKLVLLDIEKLRQIGEEI